MPPFLPYTATAAATNTVLGTRSNCPPENTPMNATMPQMSLSAMKLRMLSDVKRPVTPVPQAAIQRPRTMSVRNNSRCPA